MHTDEHSDEQDAVHTDWCWSHCSLTPALKYDNCDCPCHRPHAEQNRYPYEWDRPYDEWPVGQMFRAISDMIDGTYPADLDPEAHLFRRVMKVAEETGEVTEALFGYLGENPRKGRTHTLEDVRKELMDVALAALAACAHIDVEQDHGAAFAWHAMEVYERLGIALDWPDLKPRDHRLSPGVTDGGV